MNNLMVIDGIEVRRDAYQWQCECELRDAQQRHD